MSAPVMNLLSYRCIPPHLQGKVLDEAANEQVNAFNVALQKANAPRGTVLSPAPSGPWVATVPNRSPCCGPCCSTPSSKSVIFAICWQIRNGWAMRSQGSYLAEELAGE